MRVHDRVKVFFPLETSSSNGVTGEWLWVKPLDDHKYEIDNSPFDIYGVSYKDVVHAEEIEGVLTFKSVAYRGGHSTYRLRLPRFAEHKDFLEIWRSFKEHNCTYEGADDSRRLYSIDVPPQSDIFAVYDLLENGEKAGKFEFEEAHYCKPQDLN